MISKIETTPRGSFDRRLVSLVLVCVIAGIMLWMLSPIKATLPQGGSELYEVAMLALLCSVGWMIWSFLIHLLFKRIHRNASYNLTAAACFRAFAFSFLLCNVLICILSFVSISAIGALKSVQVYGVSLFFFPLFFCLSTLFAIVFLFKQYSTERFVSKAVAIFFIAVSSLLFQLLFFLLWLSNGRVAAIG